MKVIADKNKRITIIILLLILCAFSVQTVFVIILANRVELLNSNKLECAELKALVKAIANSDKTLANKSLLKKPALGGANKDPEIHQEGDTFTISKAEKDNILRRARSLLLDIDAVPYVKDGMVQGLRILNIKSNSIFQKLGWQKGDVLKSINGKTINLKNGQELFQSFKDATEFNVEIDRDGVPQSLNYKII